MASVAATPATRALTAVLPRGTVALDDETWAHRHALLTRLLFAQALLLGAFGLASGVGPLHAFAHVAIPGALGAVAWLGPPSRAFRSLAVAIGLLTESALLVHLSDGAIEAHFHFFVMLAALALYEDAVPYALGVLYVVLEHGVVGALAPHAVYDSAGRAADPWIWAGIHGGFIAFAAAVHVLTWRTNERVRRRLRDAEERQAQERGRAERYLELAGALVLALDERGVVTVANGAACAALGYEREAVVGRNWFELAVPPAERAERRAIFDRLLAGGPDERGETVALGRDGRRVTISWRHTAVRDADGRVVGTLSSGLDVTVQRAVEAELEQERHDIAALARASRRIAAATDARQAVVDAACEVSGAAFAVLVEPSADGELRPARAAGVELDPRVKPGRGRREASAAIAYVAATPYLVHDLERSDAGVPGDGRVASVLHQPAVLDGRVRGVLTVGWDEHVGGVGARSAELTGMLADDAALAIDRAERQRAMELAAMTDSLTGVANRRGWDAALALALRDARNRGAPLCVAVVDLDRFKALNDERGHAAGDRALERCAAAWRDVLRPTDTLARIGGDEFAVLLPDCDLEEARRVRERLVLVAPHEAGCSIGIARWDGREGAGALVSRADRDLYRVKAERADAEARAVPPAVRR